MIVHKLRKIYTMLFLAILSVTIYMGTDIVYGEVKNSCPTADEIAQYASNHPTGEFSHDYKGKALNNEKIQFAQLPKLTAPYSPGVLSEKEQIKGLNTIKILRYIAGLDDDVYLSDIMSQYAQAACLINYVNGTISHTPVIPEGMSKKLADMGYVGSKVSNLARVPYKNTNLKWSIIHGWMDDSSGENIKVLGHRRWILNPHMNMTGFGTVVNSKGTYTAMYAMDSTNNVTDKVVIKWPAENTPTSYFNPNSPWSVCINEKVNKKNVIVAMTRVSDGKSWTFRNSKSDGDFYVNNDKYGTESCIIFRPNIDQIKSGDSFAIVILCGREEISYNVKFFDLEHYFSPEKPATPELAYTNHQYVSISWKEDPLADSYSIYRRPSKGKWKLIADDLDDTFFKDYSFSEGLKYEYRIIAGKRQNKEVYYSYPSDSQSVVIPLSDTEAECEWVNGKLSLTWSFVPKATGYKIYRKVDSSWKLIGKTKKLSFPIKKYKGSSFRIRAFRTYKGNTIYGKYAYV